MGNMNIEGSDELFELVIKRMHEVYPRIPESYLREDTMKYFRITLNDQMEQMADLFGRMAKAKKSGIRIEMPEIKALTKLIAGEHKDAIKKELEMEDGA